MPALPQLEKFYSESEAATRNPSAPESPSSELITVSVKEMPLTDFLRVLAAQHNVSVLWSEGLDRRLVSVEATNVPVDEIFAGLARRFNVAVNHVGQSWYVGEFRDEDRATLVRKTVRLTPDDVTSAVAVVLGESGRVKCFKDGLVVISDQASGCRRIAAVLDEIEGARCDSWIVQLYLFSCSKTASHDLGFDSSALIDLSYTFASKSAVSAAASTAGSLNGAGGTTVTSPRVSVPVRGPQLASTFAAVMKATASRADVTLIGKPLFVLGDGEKASFVSGLSVPVPKKTVSDQGTVTTSGYDQVQSGLSSDVSLHEGPHNSAMLDVHVSLGQITGYVESAPIQSKNDFSTSAVLNSAGVYLLGALDEDDATLGATGLTDRLMTRNTKDMKHSQIQIWARLYRIAGAYKPATHSSLAVSDAQTRPARKSEVPSPVHSAEIVEFEVPNAK